MSLVPPEDLQDIFGQAAVGPLSVAEREKIAELVTLGFDQWKQFHERYSQQQRQIQALDPGEATFRDLSAFATLTLGAVPAEGFSSLRFLWQDGEVVSAQRTAEVLSIEGRPYACGDHGGMPVTRDDGVKAERLGSNVGVITKALRAHGFPATPAGAAHVRWPEGEPRPHDGPFGVVIVARQSVRWEQGSYAEHAAALHCATVSADGQSTPLSTHAKGALVRELGRATVRREPENAPALVAAIQQVEASMLVELRRPSDAEREGRVVHAVTPLLAAVVT